MKRLLTAIVLIPLVLLITFKAPLWLFVAVVALVALLAMREYLGLIRGYGAEPLVSATYLLVPLFFAFIAVTGQAVDSQESAGAFTLLTAAATLPVAFLYAVAGLRQDVKIALPSVALTGAGFIYVVFGLATVILIRVLPLGAFYLLYLFVIVWGGDAFAYWVGKSVGRHKLAPQVSPNKTWEGAIASVVSAAVLGALLLHFAPQIVGWLQRIGAIAHLDWPAREQLFHQAGAPPKPPDAFSLPLGKALLWSAVINVAAQLGDLVESMMKRGAGVKDSGALLPGHGGILDRVDALLFAAPVGFAVILLAIHS